MKAKTKDKSSAKHNCTICQNTFDYKRDLLRHTSATHEGKKEHKCNSCGQSFAMVGSLNVHIKRVHDKVFKRYGCNHCEKRFHTNQELNTLKRNVTNVEKCLINSI